MVFRNPTQETIFSYLRKAKRIAVVGLSDKEERTSYSVSKLVQQHGYEIIPVNPTLAGEKILGEKVYATLEEIPGSIDIVNVFRRSEFLPEVATSFLNIDAEVFWAQLGLENQEAADILEKAGKTNVVMNRCIAIELEKLEE